MGAMDTAMVMVMAMEAMDITTARGRLRLLTLLSPAMDTTVMATDMAMAMEAMDIMATMARDLLMLSPAMDTMVTMDMVVMDTTADMAMVMATTDKFLLLFSAVESSAQTKNLDHLVLVLNFKILNKLLDKKKKK